MRKKELISEKNEINKEKMKLFIRLNMIEYELRKYEETNGNPYTLIRDIKRIIRKEI